MRRSITVRPEFRRRLKLGLHLAGLASLPDQVMTRATAVATRLSLQETTGESDYSLALTISGRAANPANTVAMRRKALLRVKTILIGALLTTASRQTPTDS